MLYNGDSNFLCTFYHIFTNNQIGDGNMKNVHHIEIAGTELSLVSEETNAYVEKLSSELNRRINTTRLSGSNVSVTKAAIVVALDLLDENQKLRALIENEKK